MLNFINLQSDVLKLCVLSLQVAKKENGKKNTIFLCVFFLVYLRRIVLGFEFKKPYLNINFPNINIFKIMLSSTRYREAAMKTDGKAGFYGVRRIKLAASLHGFCPALEWFTHPNVESTL